MALAGILILWLLSHRQGVVTENRLCSDRSDDEGVRTEDEDAEGFGRTPLQAATLEPSEASV